MLIKTLLNRLEHFKSFVFGAVTFQLINGCHFSRAFTHLVFTPVHPGTAC